MQCVLKYDHHCPCKCILTMWPLNSLLKCYWFTGIGQCVGARNHKVWWVYAPYLSYSPIFQFFINFCQATVVFTPFVLATLTPFFVRETELEGLDVQKLVVIVLYVSFTHRPLPFSLTNLRAYIPGPAYFQYSQAQCCTPMCVWPWLVWRLWKACRWARWNSERACYSRNSIPGGNLGKLVLISNFLLFADTIPDDTVPRRRNGESGTRSGVRYGRKVISGGRGVDTQSGWMLWAFRGWDGFVSWSFRLVFVTLCSWLFFLLVFVTFWFRDIFRLQRYFFFALARGLACGSLGSIFISRDIWGCTFLFPSRGFCVCWVRFNGGAVHWNPRGRMLIRLGDIFLDVFGSSLYFLIFARHIFCPCFRIPFVFRFLLTPGEE